MISRVNPVGTPQEALRCFFGRGDFVERTYEPSIIYTYRVDPYSCYMCDDPYLVVVSSNV